MVTALQEKAKLVDVVFSPEPVQQLPEVQPIENIPDLAPGKIVTTSKNAKAEETKALKEQLAKGTKKQAQDFLKTLEYSRSGEKKNYITVEEVFGVGLSDLEKNNPNGYAWIKKYFKSDLGKIPLDDIELRKDKYGSLKVNFSFDQDGGNRTKSLWVTGMAVPMKKETVDEEQFRKNIVDAAKRAAGVATKKTPEPKGKVGEIAKPEVKDKTLEKPLVATVLVDAK